LDDILNGFVGAVIGRFEATAAYSAGQFQMSSAAAYWPRCAISASFVSGEPAVVVPPGAGAQPGLM
jgi:hypothetical protein